MTIHHPSFRRKTSRITPSHGVTTWSLAANDLLDKLSANRWIPLVVNVGVFALTIYGLGQGAWRLKAPTALPASSPPIVKTDSSADLQLLLSAQLFGHAPGTASAETGSAQIPLSSLNLVLTGVLARAMSSVALLSINGAPEAPVAIGEEVTAGATLDAVYPDHVVLRRGSALESVILRDLSTGPAPGSLTPPSAITGGSEVAPLRTSVPAGDRRVPARESGAQIPTPAALAPTGDGFVVQEVQGGSAFEQLGLRSGDVVRRVNGQLTSSPAGLLKRYDEARASPQAGRLTIEVSRSGKTETLSYPAQ